MIKLSFKLSLGILISFSLNGISSYASLSSISNPSLNDNDFETIASLPERTVNPKYQTLLNLANAFHDFCEDAYQDFKKSPSNNRQESIYLQNIESSAEIVKWIQEIDQNKTRIDIILNRVLLSRLEYIAKRSQKLLETKEYYKAHNELPDDYFLGTTPASVSKLPEENQIIAKRMIDRYQFMNLIIYHLYKITDSVDLSEKTKKLISCSRTLWSILNDETTDLSYPDFAFLTDYGQDLKELRGHKDNDYYWSNFDLIEQKIELLNWCKQETTILVSRVDLGLANAQSLLKPIWLYPAPVIEKTLPVKATLKGDDPNLLTEKSSDQLISVSIKKKKKEAKKSMNSQMESNNKVEAQKRLEDKNLANKKASSKQSFTEGNELNEKGKESSTFSQETTLSSKLPQSPLPTLTLSKSISEFQKEGQGEKTSLSDGTADERAEALPIKTPEKVGNTNLLIENLSESNNKAEEIRRVEDENSTNKESSTSSQETVSQQFPNSPTSSLISSENIPEFQKEEQSENTSLSLETTDEKEKGTPLRPRGMRLFHSEIVPQISERESILNRVNNKAYNLIDIIFNPKMKGQGFTFGEFKNLWERLNGQGTIRSSGNGSSHYALLNSEQRVIGGTFAHGEGQKYTRNTVRYLRDALNMIGIFPQN